MQNFRGSPQKITFAEGEDKKLQLFRVGTFHDDRYGKIEITKEKLAEMVKNFQEGVRGVDIALDFAHESEGQSAGWFKALELREEGTQLWGEVEYTEPGKKAVEGKVYRYVSPEFNLSYKDNETLKKFGAVLLGAGLTNRPVIKGMSPTISLRELTNKEIEEMDDVKKLTEQVNKLTLKFEEQEKEKMALEEKLKAAEAAKPEDKKAAEASTPEEMMKKISEQASIIAELQAKLKKQDEAVAMSEKNKAFDALLTKGSAVEAQREAFLANDTVKFAELSKPMKLERQGHGSDEEETEEQKDTTAEDQLVALAEKRSTEKKIKFNVALSEVLKENKELADKYNSSTKL